MGERGRQRREAQAAEEHARAQAEYDTWLAAQRTEFLAREPEPPDDCRECWYPAPHPSFGTWHWWHVWPAEQPFEDWVCRHECHGPEGAVQYVIAFA